MDEPAAGTPPHDSPPKKGMSTGAKVFFGCLAVVVLGVVVLGVVLVIFGSAVRGGIESAMGTIEDQQEATETLQRLAEEHPFEPPSDAVVGEERLERFLAVTATAWEDMEPWSEDLRQMSESEGEGIDRIQDLGSGARALGGMVQSRLALAEALEQHDTSLGEYLWTGVTLDRTNEAIEGNRTEGLPEANLQLVQARGGEIPRMDGNNADAGLVLAVAAVWGMSDLTTWRAMGLDTLAAR